MVLGSSEKARAKPRAGDDDDGGLLPLGQPADADDREIEEIRYQVEDMADDESSATGAPPIPTPIEETDAEEGDDE